MCFYKWYLWIFANAIFGFLDFLGISWVGVASRPFNLISTMGLSSLHQVDLFIYVFSKIGFVDLKIRFFGFFGGISCVRVVTQSFRLISLQYDDLCIYVCFTNRICGFCKSDLWIFNFFGGISWVGVVTW